MTGKQSSQFVSLAFELNSTYLPFLLFFCYLLILSIVVNGISITTSERSLGFLILRKIFLTSGYKSIENVETIF